MKKKPARKVKGSASKSKKAKTNSSKKAALPNAMSKTPVKPTAKPDPRFTQAVQNFEAAMKALQGQKFDRAKALLEKVMEGPSKEHAERARVYLNICVQHLARTTTNFRTPEEHYDYAVALMNNLDYNGARSHLEKILRQHPKADYAVYGLAVLECLQSRVEESLRRLEQAIKLNPNNRIQARNDSDFVNMADDPRFTELIYPEPGEMASSLSHPKNR